MVSSGGKPAGLSRLASVASFLLAAITTALLLAQKADATATTSAATEGVIDASLEECADTSLICIDDPTCASCAAVLAPVNQTDWGSCLPAIGTSNSSEDTCAGYGMYGLCTCVPVCVCVPVCCLYVQTRSDTYPVPSNVICANSTATRRGGRSASAIPAHLHECVPFIALSWSPTETLLKKYYVRGLKMYLARGPRVCKKTSA